MFERIKNLFHKNNTETEPTTCEKIDNLFDSLNEDIIHIKVGEDLTDFGEIICKLIGKLREEIKDECGFIIPEVHITDCNVIQENEFAIYIRGEFCTNGFLVPNEKGINEELYEVLKTFMYDNMNRIFTNEITERYIDTAQRKNGWLIWNITRFLSVVDIRIILSEIINKGKSINDISYVFEKISENLFREGNYTDCYWKKSNPHRIACDVAKDL